MDNSLNQLFEAARKQPANDAVPYAFEQRVMAHLRGVKAEDLLSSWAAALWRGAVACLLISLVSSAWALWSPSAGEDSAEFSREFDQALVVMAEPQFDDTW